MEDTMTVAIHKDVPLGDARSMDCESLIAEVSGLRFALDDEDLPIDELLAMLEDQTEEELFADDNDVRIFLDESDWAVVAQGEAPEKQTYGTAESLNDGAKFENWFQKDSGITEDESEDGPDTELEQLKAVADIMFFSLFSRLLAQLMGKTLLAKMILTAFDADQDHEDWYIPPKINELCYNPEKDLLPYRRPLNNFELSVLTQLSLIERFGDPWEKFPIEEL
jgi:hypothetical protein